MEGRDELTLKAASRLIKSRLRRFVYSHMAEKTMWLDEALGFENVISGSAEEGWDSVLLLWDLSKPEIRKKLLAQVQAALAAAISDTEALLVDGKEGSLEGESEKIRPLIEAYRQGFRPEDLLS